MNKARKLFSDIYDRYVDKIYRFIYIKVGAQEAAEDLTSEVFTRAWQRFRGSYALNNDKPDSGAIENMQAFLYRIASNLVVDYYRQKGQISFVSTENVVTADPVDVEAKVAVQSDMEAIKSAMAAIKDDYREVLVWYYLDELSAPEIAKITKKSEEAVRVTIHRALQALREHVNGDKAEV